MNYKDALQLADYTLNMLKNSTPHNCPNCNQKTYHTDLMGLCLDCYLSTEDEISDWLDGREILEEFDEAFEALCNQIGAVPETYAYRYSL